MSTTDSPKGASSILDARASDAGDVFHELWALRCALRLLIPRTELKAVTVEGVKTLGSANPPKIQLISLIVQMDCYAGVTDRAICDTRIPEYL